MLYVYYKGKPISCAFLRVYRLAWGCVWTHICLYPFVMWEYFRGCVGKHLRTGMCWNIVYYWFLQTVPGMNTCTEEGCWVELLQGIRSLHFADSITESSKGRSDHALAQPFWELLVRMLLSSLGVVKIQSPVFWGRYKKTLKINLWRRGFTCLILIC